MIKIMIKSKNRGKLRKRQFLTLDMLFVRGGALLEYQKLKNSFELCLKIYAKPFSPMLIFSKPGLLISTLHKKLVKYLERFYNHRVTGRLTLRTTTLTKQELHFVGHYLLAFDYLEHILNIKLGHSLQYGSNHPYFSPLCLFKIHPMLLTCHAHNVW